MGLRSPQEMNQVQTAKAPDFRLQGVQAPQLDKSFLATASKGFAAAEEQRKKALAEQLDFIKTQADNDAENDTIIAKAELAQIEGLNTLDSSKKLGEKLRETFEKRKQKIPEKFHPYVDQIFAKKLTRYNSFAVPHTQGQVKKVKDEADKVYAANAINEAIEESGDIDSFNSALGKVTYALAKRAEKKFGGNKELVQEAIVQGNSEAIRRAVEQQAVLGRFDKANQLLKWGDDELTPNDRVKAIKLMEQARDDLGDKEASDLANAAATQYPEDLVKQELWLRSASRNDKVNRAAVAFLRSRTAVEKLNKEKQLEQTYAKINNARLQGEDPLQFAMELPPGEEREKVFKWYNDTRGGQNTFTNFATFDKLNDRITDAISAKDLPDSFLDAYRHEVSPAHMSVLESKYERLKGQDNAEIRRVHQQNYKLVEETFNAWAGANKLTGKSKNDERNVARIAMMEEVERVLTINPKIDSRQLNARALNTLRERGIKTEIVPRTFFGMDIPFTSKEVKNPAESLAPDNSPKVDPSWYEEIRRRNPSLNESQINATIQVLIKNGQKVDAPLPR